MDDHARGQRSDDRYAATRPLTLGLTLVLPLALLTVSFLLTCHSTVGSTQLLINPDFEDGPAGWEPCPPDMNFMTVTEPVNSGQWAASLDRSGSTDEIYVFQEVSVVPGGAYTLTGWAYKHQTRFAEACLRVNWLHSASADVENCVEVEYDGYRPITIGLAIAPTDAITARIMAVAKQGVPGDFNPVCFDDLSFTSGATPTPIAIYLPLVLKGYTPGLPPPVLRSGPRGSAPPACWHTCLPNLVSRTGRVLTVQPPTHPAATPVTY